MAHQKLSNSSRKNWLNATIISLVFLFSSQAFAESGGHGGGHGGGAKKEEEQGAFSKDELDSMKQSQLLYYLSNPNYQSSEYATYYFVQKGKAGVTPLLNYLKDNEDEDKKVSAIIYTFGRMGPNAARAVPIMSHYLKHENYEIRRTTIAALGKIGKASDPAVPEIAKYLEADDQWTRDIALRALKDIKSKQSKLIAAQYERKIKLDEERKNKALMSGKEEGK
jgi:hypothetical protein